MKLASISLFLLESLPALAVAAVSNKIQTYNNGTGTAIITKRDGEGTIEVQPSYHAIDDRSLGHAVNCLAKWCDEDHFIRKAGGMVRCRTPGDHGAEVFICNVGEIQRCSSRQLSKAINELRSAGSTTGSVVHEMARDRGLKFGFDYFCKAGHKECPNKEDEYDATRRHCLSRPFQQAKIQHDDVVDVTRGLGKLKFTGWDWVRKPEEDRPQEYAYGFQTVYDKEDLEAYFPVGDPNSGPWS